MGMICSGSERMLRGGAVLQLDIGVLPGDEIADREAAQERVHQVAHLRLAPDKGTLDFGDGDLTLRDPREDNGDGVLVDGVFGLGHE